MQKKNLELSIINIMYVQNNFVITTQKIFFCALSIIFNNILLFYYIAITTAFLSIINLAISTIKKSQKISSI